MKKTTQKQLKQLKQLPQIQSVSYANGLWTVKTIDDTFTDLSNKTVITVSTGTYGVNGAMVEFTTEQGEKLAFSVIGRSNVLFQLI